MNEWMNYGEDIGGNNNGECNNAYWPKTIKTKRKGNTTNLIKQPEKLEKKRMVERWDEDLNPILIRESHSGCKSISKESNGSENMCL